MSFEQAKEYCTEDEECLSIQDGCDGKAPFSLCRNFYSTIAPLNHWCQHKKVLSHGMFKRLQHLNKMMYQNHTTGDWKLKVIVISIK